MVSDHVSHALNILRDGSHFQWTVIPLFAFVVYVYAVEVEKKNWNLVCAGLAFWGMDWFNEIWNSLVFHFTQTAPVWCAPGNTSFLILIGLNIEICFMFAVAGVTFAKLLPYNKHLKIAGINNRIVLAVVFSAFCVFVEILLNRIDALTWEYSWWNAKTPWLILIFGYLHFFLISFWVFDMNTIRKKMVVLTLIYSVDGLAILLFGLILGWL